MGQFPILTPPFETETDLQISFQMLRASQLETGLVNWLETCFDFLSEKLDFCSNMRLNCLLPKILGWVKKLVMKASAP